MNISLEQKLKQNLTRRWEAGCEFLKIIQWEKIAAGQIDSMPDTMSVVNITDKTACSARICHLHTVLAVVK